MEEDERRWCFFGFFPSSNRVGGTKKASAEKGLCGSQPGDPYYLQIFVLFQQSCGFRALCHQSGPGVWSGVVLGLNTLQLPERPAGEI